jgi:quinol monooxygenase YgiN
MKYIVVVRGTLKAASEQEARAVHDAILEQLPAIGRPLGAIGHQPYLNPQNPQEFLAVDRWTSLQGLQQFMSDPNVGAAFGNLFAGPPDVTIWRESGWASFSDE